MQLASWLRECSSCYIGNATAKRDYRVQLRGNRAVLLWTLYLIVLIGFAMAVYGNTMQVSRQSIVSAQSSLRSFYQSVMILLAGVVVVITPALTAGAIVMERQRHSLDLVFSAPVKPKYLLIGKMISSYRYTWMLLILSLPVTSACVVLGGATWSDVISAYIILSLNALIYTSIALLLSTLARQPVSAVIWSYVAAIGYSIFSAAFVGSSAFSMGFGRTMEMPFVVTLNPFFVVQSAPSFTTWQGHQIPNWILGGITALLFSKLMLLGAGSALSGYGSPETKSLRIHCWIYSGLAFALYGYAASASVSRIVHITGRTGPGFTSSVSSSTSWESGVNQMFGWILMAMVVFLPAITCYGRDGERKFWPDGLFSWKATFLGTPAGALPFIYGIVLVGFFSLNLVYGQIGSTAMGFSILFWALAFWTFMWSLGRLASSFNSGLRSARALHFTLMMMLIALPVPFLSALSTFDSDSSSIWDIYILRPILGSHDNSGYAWVMGGIMIVAAFLVTAIATVLGARKGSIEAKGAA
ncbi:MAG: hypothetical protein BGO01_12800 [Armatimonadetes bacterium 55-13]|mgnify:CR=1 FL=1|nr:ABC transporter permease subunit [Armatimonadota bacterium]OJU61790.1 MAG: hypothetical protein BGO01_12800 [Armatimonadetes bacterium 55-13]